MNNDLEKELKELQIQYDKVLKERNELEKENKLLKKDLEVLEILKNVFNYKSIQQFIDSMSKEQWLKIKEWYNGSL